MPENYLTVSAGYSRAFFLVHTSWAKETRSSCHQMKTDCHRSSGQKVSLRKFEVDWFVETNSTWNDRWLQRIDEYIAEVGYDRAGPYLLRGTGTKFYSVVQSTNLNYSKWISAPPCLPAWGEDCAQLFMKNWPGWGQVASFSLLSDSTLYSTTK